MLFRSCSEFALYGISDPLAGCQDLKANKVYDFIVDEEIDTHRELVFGEYYGEDRFKNYILQKEFSANSDTVYYLVHYCGWTHITHPGQSQYFYYNDTLVSTIK